MLKSASSPALTSILLLASIGLGTLIGHTAPAAGQWLGDQIDYTLLALIGSLFFSVQFGALLQAVGNLRFLLIALLANFVLVPLIGYGVASLLLADHPLLMIGLVIYFMSPCTDWFLGFTRLSGGNVALGTTLIPLNMTLQLLLYPVYLHLFTHYAVQVEASVIGDTLRYWFLLPLLVAIALHQLLRRTLGTHLFGHVLRRVDQATPWVIALLVLQIFAGNISVILAYQAVFAWLLLAVFVFFVTTFLVGEGLSHLLRLPFPDHALLTMTIAARNAPLMLAVTMAVLPGQPLIYAALVIGMLVEFPHLTALRRLLLAVRHRFPSASATSGSASASAGVHYIDNRPKTYDQKKSPW